MRWGTFEQMWNGIMAAEVVGLTPIKLNAVVTAGFNETDVVDLARPDAGARLAREVYRVDAPLGGGECASISIQALRFRISRPAAASGPNSGPLADVESGHPPSDEAVNLSAARRQGHRRFSHQSGQRALLAPPATALRLTADGKFHLCLLNDDELDVRKAIRSGASTAANVRPLKLLVSGRNAQAHRPSPTGRPLTPRIARCTQRRRVSSRVSIINCPRCISPGQSSVIKLNPDERFPVGDQSAKPERSDMR